MLKFLLPALCLTLAVAPPASAAEEAAGAEAVSKDSKMVCKRVANTGWRLQGARVCKTSAEWAHLSREQQREHEEYGSINGRRRCQACLRDAEVGRRSGL